MPTKKTEPKVTTSKKATTTKKKSTTKKSTKSESNVLICNVSQLAKMLGVTERQIYNQIDNGVVIKVGVNKLDCIKSVQNYIGKLREAEELRKQTPEQLNVETAAVKLEHERLKARKTELQVLQMEGKLHYEEDVKALWDSSVIAAKSRLTSIGVKIAPQLRGETDETVIQDFIDREIYEALKEVSNYDPSSYSKDLTADDSDNEDEDE